MAGKEEPAFTMGGGGGVEVVIQGIEVGLGN